MTSSGLDQSRIILGFMVESSTIVNDASSVFSTFS